MSMTRYLSGGKGYGLCTLAYSLWESSELFRYLTDLLLYTHEIKLVFIMLLLLGRNNN